MAKLPSPDKPAPGKRTVGPADSGLDPLVLDARHLPDTHGPLPHLLLCRCGHAWSVSRIPTKHALDEHMNCVCGELLMRWSERADYVFEPLPSDDLLDD